MDLKEIIQQNAKVYFIGIKGTGMCALAELLCQSGAKVCGSDTSEVFYTDKILNDLEIPFYESFDPSHVPSDAAMVIHSAAYNEKTNPEMARAKKLKIPLLKYPDALGAYSAFFDSSGIAGVHGKTTTTALVGTLFRAAGLPAQVLAGSAVSVFRNHSTLCLGDKYFAAETCEYRSHFLAFNPQRIILTSVESDHQDYFPTYDDIRDAFIEYALKIPSGGELIYCADDKGASEVTEMVKQKRDDIVTVPYGFNANGSFKISSYEVKDERLCFCLEGFPDTEFKLRVPGKHCVLNAAAALALTDILVKKEYGIKGWTQKHIENAVAALEAFAGSRRRSEIIGQSKGVLFMDDYAHHPTAIKSTLLGLKEFYPNRRIVVSFMSHTYSRTEALLQDFAESLLCADMLVLHKIYASAREERKSGKSAICGETLFEKTKEAFEKENRMDKVLYIEEPLDAAEELKGILQEGDLFITMGAGDNFRLGKKLLMMY